MEHQSNGWSGAQSASTPGALPPISDGQAHQPARHGISYNPAGNSNQAPGQMNGGPSLQTSGAFFSGPGGVNSLAAITNLTQNSPPRPSNAPSLLHQSPPSRAQRHMQGLGSEGQQPQGPGYPLPTIAHAMQQATGNDREYREASLREAERRIHENTLPPTAEREAERRDEQRGTDQPTTSEANAASLTLQAPIASRAASTLHGPNGILSSNPNVSSALAGPNALGNSASATSNTPGGLVGSYLQPNASHHAQPSPSFSASMAPSAGTPSSSQNQQPILNDALSYLDLVKMRFQEYPDIYNKFLDIMKDFKSQSIDTPGVINRVSTLFNGHPELIQGFNTFLPPGYKIECGLNDDPNSIRVTTPMGTTVSSLTNMPMQLAGAVRGPPNGAMDAVGPGDGSHAMYPLWQSHNAADGADRSYSPQSRVSGPATYSQQAMSRSLQVAPYGLRDDDLNVADVAALAHQQERNGVSQLTSAVTAATDGANGRAMLHPAANDLTVGAMGVATANLHDGAAAQAQAGLDKRGPVEFDHAINYVNKIKNRFAGQPEVYKQFLEILQTYQRESKPIQDVYAQVTQLFNAAPDLLEDFKQFLPESAAQAKAQAAARQAEEAAIFSNVRSEPSYVSNMPANASTPQRSDAKMPPLGNFAPPSSVGKESKKRRGGAGAMLTIGASTANPDLGVASQGARSGGAVNNAKRPRMSIPKPSPAELPAISPSLVPELPVPLPPTQHASSTSDEIAFFDRVKKYVSNRQTFNEFLKLCNLYSQDLIDRNLLILKADNFIGSNPELMTWFKNFVSYSGADEVIDNKPVPSDTKVVLSNCRSLGPSYRLLPKRDWAAQCSGRDNMCHAVLNDKWASHPTWASEDSGFVSHRKNQFEEALHRMEEERHDYDFNIETCLRTIQLLDPIVQQIHLMGDEEKRGYKLPPGLGGQSEAIWMRVIKKIYDRQRGTRVIEDMITRPTAVCPIVLARLKHKVEEWKGGQREWEKIWRDQTTKQFWKSLDHQGISARAENKRQFQPKTLQTEIQARYEEQKRDRVGRAVNVPPYQFDFAFDDVEVIQDASHVLLTYLHHAKDHAGEQAKVEAFFKSFIPTFFGLEKSAFAARMSDIYTDPPPDEEEDDSPPNDDATTHRGRRSAINGKKGTLLRGVLDKSQPRHGRKDTAISRSKESTPDLASRDDGSLTPTDSLGDPAKSDRAESRWLEPSTTATLRARYHSAVNEPYLRESFTLYSNLNIYCFLRVFQIFYMRLVSVKQSEEQVRDHIGRSKAPKAAYDLRLAERSPTDYFADTSATANYYQQLLKMCEDVVKGDEDMPHVEDVLRRFYMDSGWQLYNFDRMLQAIVRFAVQILGSDGKDRSNDITNAFYRNRKEAMTTHQAEIDYRKSVEKYSKDSDMYRIDYNQHTQHVTIQIFRKDDKTFDTNDMTAAAKWSYYVSSYGMIDWTEGVPQNIAWPFLRRNYPSHLHTEEDFSKAFVPMFNHDELEVRIDPETYHLLWEKGTTDWWAHSATVARRGLNGVPAMMQERKQRFQEKFVTSPAWMVGKSSDEVEKINVDFQAWIAGAEVTVNGDGAAAIKADTD